MAKHRKETPKRRIMRLIRTAFYAAETGEDVKARSLMDAARKTANDSGSEIDPHTIKGFVIAIQNGLRDTRR